MYPSGSAPGAAFCYVPNDDAQSHPRPRARARRPDAAGARRPRVAPSHALLISGGAGYVGCHAVLAFRDAGYDVAVLDDLSTGARSAVPPGVAFIEGDAGNPATVRDVIDAYRVKSVIHLAASTSVPESVADPDKYDRNNTVASANLIRACVSGGVKYLLFASSAAVYGAPATLPVAEDAPLAPLSPYGHSKLATERTLHDTALAHDIRYMALRYFNVAGADPRGRAGPPGAHPLHLIRAACQAASGLRGGLTVFGTDYDTPDGTCVRDYIHVADLADIHVAALRALQAGAPSRVLNCGYGRGHSVREVLRAVRSQARAEFLTRDGPRRPGDPGALVSDNSRLRAALRWSPRHDDLGLIVRTALAWERTLHGKPSLAPA